MDSPNSSHSTDAGQTAGKRGGYLSSLLCFIIRLLLQLIDQRQRTGDDNKLILKANRQGKIQ
jgi:hypothetical protein